MSPGSPLTYTPQIPMEPLAKVDDTGGHRHATEFVGAAGWPAQPKLVPVVVTCEQQPALIQQAAGWPTSNWHDPGTASAAAVDRLCGGLSSCVRRGGSCVRRSRRGGTVQWAAQLFSCADPLASSVHSPTASCGMLVQLAVCAMCRCTLSNPVTSCHPPPPTTRGPWRQPCGGGGVLGQLDQPHPAAAQRQGLHTHQAAAARGVPGGGSGARAGGGWAEGGMLAGWGTLGQAALPLV